jgi:hypothetical protein
MKFMEIFLGTGVKVVEIIYYVYVNISMSKLVNFFH